jgi:hypothetical protein
VWRRPAEGGEVVTALGGVHSGENHLGAGAEFVCVGQDVANLVPHELIDHRHNDGAAVTSLIIPDGDHLRREFSASSLWSFTVRRPR